MVYVMGVCPFGRPVTEGMAAATIARYQRTAEGGGYRTPATACRGGLACGCSGDFDHRSVASKAASGFGWQRSLPAELRRGCSGESSEGCQRGVDEQMRTLAADDREVPRLQLAPAQLHQGVRTALSGAPQIIWHGPAQCLQCGAEKRSALRVELAVDDAHPVEDRAHVESTSGIVVLGVCERAVRINAVAQVTSEYAQTIRIQLSGRVEQRVTRAFDRIGADVLHRLGKHCRMTEANLAAPQEVLGCGHTTQEASHLAACHGAAHGETASVAQPGNE